MNKKKLVSLCLVLALVLTAVVGGTMAYFTDKEAAKNTFVVGDVKIDLNEENKAGDVDEDYQEWLAEQKLIPTTQAKVENTIDKIVTVKNTGTNDAYMWAEIWVPASLDDGDTNSDTAPGIGNSLHFNYDASKVKETKAAYLGSKEIGEGENAVLYNGYVHYEIGAQAYAKDATTTELLKHVYMDANVTQCTDANCENGEGCLVLMDGKTHYAGSWDMIVYGIGIQADTFDSIEDAIATYYNKPL